jgi:hypothetical protein
MTSLVLDFVNSSNSVQQVIEPTAGDLVLAQLGASGQLGDVPVALDMVCGQVYAHSDPCQSYIQSPSDIRYCISLRPSHVIYDYVPCRQIGVVPSSCEVQNTPSMTPGSVNSTLASLSNNTPFFPMQFDGDPSLNSPFASVHPIKYWDSASDLDEDFEILSPLTSPFAPVDPTSDVEMASDSEFNPLHQRRQRTDRRVALLGVLQQLRKLKFTVIDILTFIINGEDSFQGYCNTLFLARHHASLIGLLERLIQDKKGGPIVTDWMFPHALCLVCKRIHVEMEAAKPQL